MLCFKNPFNLRLSMIILTNFSILILLKDYSIKINSNAIINCFIFRSQDVGYVVKFYILNGIFPSKYNPLSIRIFKATRHPIFKIITVFGGSKFIQFSQYCLLTNRSYASVNGVKVTRLLTVRESGVRFPARPAYAHNIPLYTPKKRSTTQIIHITFLNPS